jgi:hypothetical protein
LELEVIIIADSRGENSPSIAEELQDLSLLAMESTHSKLQENCPVKNQRTLFHLGTVDLA